MKCDGDDVDEFVMTAPVQFMLTINKNAEPSRKVEEKNGYFVVCGEILYGYGENERHNTNIYQFVCNVEKFMSIHSLLRTKQTSKHTD